MLIKIKIFADKGSFEKGGDKGMNLWKKMNPIKDQFQK